MNAHRPEKGSQITVLPIMDQKDIARLKKILADRPRDLAIFVAGIYTNLRASDLLNLTVGQVKHLKPRDVIFRHKEKKTGKERTITINQIVYDALQSLLATMPDAQDDEPLFQSRKTHLDKKTNEETNRLTVSTLNNMVKAWCIEELKLKGNYGSHTLRKTFGYMHRTVVGTDIPTLMQMFNHSTQKQTLAYLCIQPTEIEDAYMKEF